MLYSTQTVVPVLTAILVAAANAVALDDVTNQQLIVFESPVRLNLSYGDDYESLGMAAALQGVTDIDTLEGLEIPAEVETPTGEETPPAEEQAPEEEVTTSGRPEIFTGGAIQMPSDPLPPNSCMTYSEHNYGGRAIEYSVGIHSRHNIDGTIKSMACPIGLEMEV